MESKEQSYKEEENAKHLTHPFYDKERDKDFTFIGQFVGSLNENDYIEFAKDEIVSPELFHALLKTLSERFSDIEFTIKPKKKKEIATRAQKLLIMYHLGLLERLDEQKMTTRDRAKLLSILLDSSADNIEDDLSHIKNSKNKRLRTKSNYEFLKTIFSSFKLIDKEEEADLILDGINRSNKK